MRIVQSDLKPPRFGKSGIDRHEGTHLSDALDAIDNALDRAGVRAGNWDKHALFEMGFCWEEAFELAFKKRMVGVQTQHVIECDGVYCSLDGLTRDRVVEFKATFKSSNGFDLKGQRRWLMQIKGYCHAAARLKARFYVFFVRGDYSTGPVCRCFDVTFTRKELDANWELVLSALGKTKRRRRRRKG